MKKRLSPIGVSILVFAIILGTFATIRLTNIGTPFLNPVGDVMNSVLQPIEGFFLRVGSDIKEGVSSVFAFRSIQQENEVLRQDLERVTVENALLREELLADERYRALAEGEFQAPTWDKYEKIGASIVSRNQNAWYQTVKINKGRQQGVLPNAPVVGGAGLVGKVISVSETTAEVLLITDAQGQASSFVRKAQGEIIYGVLYGTYQHGPRLQNDGVLQMDFSQEDEVELGDLVMTSGLGGVFPKGIVIGTVSDVDMQGSGLMKVARVTPAVNFDRLEEVYVMREQS